MPRILAAWWQQETNSFNPNRTTLADFEHTALHFGDEISRRFLGTRSDWGELFHLAEKEGWTVETPLYAHAVPGGIMDDLTFNQLAATILRPLEGTESIDGIFLMLHGAMVSESFEDCEGELLRRIRATIGSDIPIVVTLDPHANVTHRMAVHANALVAYRTTPHVDQVDTTRRAFDLLREMMATGERMQVRLFKPPVVAGLDSGRTTKSDAPMPRILAAAEKLASGVGHICHVSIQAGFSYSDIAEIGPSIAITTRAAIDRVSELGQVLCRMIWDSRREKSVQFLDVPTAMRQAAEWSHGGRPLLIIDYADNPGGGATGDDIALLRGLIEHKIAPATFFSLWAPDAVRTCLAAGLGASVLLRLGPRGGSDKDRLELMGEVAAISDGSYIRRGPYFTGTSASLGPSVLFRSQGVDIILCSIANQTEERAQFALFGVEFERQRFVVCKGMNHFRADLEALVDGLIFVDSGAVCTVDVRRIPYRNVRRPIWPLDDLGD